MFRSLNIITCSILLAIYCFLNPLIYCMSHQLKKQIDIVALYEAVSSAFIDVFCAHWQVIGEMEHGIPQSVAPFTQEKTH